MTTSNKEPEEATKDEGYEEILPSYTNHDGFLMPKGFPINGFVSGLQYKAQENDLFVATYPKCGTTWTQHIVYLILNDGKPLLEHERLDKVFPHLEEVGADFVSDLPPHQGYRLIKTHLSYDKTPQNPKAKYIYVARNPKDCVVSFFHHTRGFDKHYNFANGTFDTYFRLFADGRVDFGSYFDNIKSWIEHRRDSNVLFLTYEHLKAHTSEAILEIATFLDSKLYPEKLLANNRLIMNSIVEHSSLKSMKKHPLRWCSERPANHTPFIRKGSVGEWDELLQPEQTALLEERIRQVLSPEELKFLGQEY